MEHPIRAAASAASTPACPLPMTTTPYFLAGLIMFHVEPSARPRKLQLQNTNCSFFMWRQEDRFGSDQVNPLR